MKLRRNQLVVAIVAILATLLAACGGASDTESSAADSTEASTDQLSGEIEPSTGELSILYHYGPAHPQGPNMQEALRLFTEANPDIELTERGATMEEVWEVYETQILAGQEPDIIMLNAYGPPTDWLEADAVVGVSDYIDEWGLADRIHPAALAQWTHNEMEEIQAFPYLGAAMPHWYYMPALEEAGFSEPPTEMSEFLDLVEALEGSSYGPLAVGGGDWGGNKFFWQVMLQFLTDEEAIDLLGSGGFQDHAGARQGVELFVELRDAGAFIEDAEGLTTAEANEQFMAGEAAMMHNGSWAFLDTPEDMVDDIVFGGLPLAEGSVRSQPLSYIGYTGAGLWISPSGAENIDAVRAFIEHMYSSDVNRLFIEESVGIPALLNVDYDAEKVHPLIEQSFSDEYLDTVELPVYPDVVVPGNVLTATERVTSQAYISGTTADEILSGLDQAYTNAG